VGFVPVTVTLIVATVPAHTVVLAGCLVIVIGVCNVITALPLTVPAQFASLTLAIVYVVATFGFTTNVPVVPVNVAVVPSLNATTNGAVPVSATVSVAGVLAQIVWLPLSVAVGSGFTVTVAVETVKLVPTHVLRSVTLTNVYVVVPAGVTEKPTPLTTLFTVTVEVLDPTW
jgi:hypothetical protein